MIELKGGNIDEAIGQLEAGEQKCRQELKEYSFFYRIVCSKARTHKIQSSKFRKFKEKCAGRLEVKEGCLSETLDSLNDASEEPVTNKSQSAKLTCEE